MVRAEGEGGRKMLRTKPKCLTKSASYVETLLLRIRVDDRRRRIGLVFWVQRHLSSTLDRARRGARPRFYRSAAREAIRFGTKPESALESVTKEAWYTSLLRIRVDDRRRRIGLVFWVQRRRYWTLEPAMKSLPTLERGIEN